MVESKLSKVKVNNEIELCEVYDGSTKERIKKVFFREGISFYIKFKKKFNMSGIATVNLADMNVDERKENPPEHKEGRYIICVNKSQATLAKNSIMRVVPDYCDKVNFFDESGRREGRLPFWNLAAQIE